MADGLVQVPVDGAGKKLRTVVVDTDKHQQVVTLADGAGDEVDPLTDAQLRAAPLPVSGTVVVSGAVSGPLTDAELRAAAVPVTVDQSDLDGLAVTGPLTDTQLRATPVPVSGAVTISDGSGPVTVDGTVGVSGTVPVSGPLTDTQLRAASLPVTISDGAGPVTVDGTVAVSGTVPVSGPATDTQLRATPLPVLNKVALIPVAYDYMSLSYTGTDLTGVVYKTGGSGGTTVATLTLAYTSGVLQSVTRT